MLRVTLVRSGIGYNKRQRATLKALGLGKIGSSVVQADSPSILGMINKVSHLLKVEHLQDAKEVKE